MALTPAKTQAYVVLTYDNDADQIYVTVHSDYSAKHAETYFQGEHVQCVQVMTATEYRVLARNVEAGLRAVERTR
jgi:hypothetical protein